MNNITYILNNFSKMIDIHDLKIENITIESALNYNNNIDKDYALISFNLFYNIVVILYDCYTFEIEKVQFKSISALDIEKSYDYNYFLNNRHECITNYFIKEKIKLCKEITKTTTK